MTTTTTSQNEKSLTKISQRLGVNMQAYGLIFALIVIWIFFFFMTDGVYLSPQNFSNLFRQMTITAILSVGMVLVIVATHIDLSVGKLAGFVSVVVAYFQAYTINKYMPGASPVLVMVLSVLVGLVVGTLYGVLQAYIIAYIRVPAFIVTLGSMWILTGMILVRTEGKTIPANQPLFSEIGQGYLSPTFGWIIAVGVGILLFALMFDSRRRKALYGFALVSLWQDVLKTMFFTVLVFGYVFYVNQYSGVQNPVLLLAILVVIVTYVSNNTRFGRYVYAVGGNREASRLSGIDIQRNTFIIFVLMGFLCGVSGVVMASYVGYGTIAAGGGYELFAIAACFLGGTSTLGGEGTIVGAMVGALIIASLTNGLQIMNVAAAWQYVVSGIVLVVAVAVDVRMKRR